MKEFIFFMHNDAGKDANNDAAWETYLSRLKRTGRFSGGSSIGGGACFAKGRGAPAITAHITGFICVEAEDLASAQQLLNGNPTFEGGGTVEIRELLPDGQAQAAHREHTISRHASENSISNAILNRVSTPHDNIALDSHTIQESLNKGKSHVRRTISRTRPTRSRT
jgi:hypothetical protein